MSELTKDQVDLEVSEAIDFVERLRKERGERPSKDLAPSQVPTMASGYPAYTPAPSVNQGQEEAPKQRSEATVPTRAPSMSSGFPSYSPAPPEQKKPEEDKKKEDLSLLSEEDKKIAKQADDAIAFVSDLRKEQKPPENGQFTTIDTAKQAAVKGIESAAESISFEEPKPPVFESATHLSSLTPDEITPEIRDAYKNVSDPEELKQWPEWFPKTDAQHRALFDQKHEKTTSETLKDIWNVVPGIMKGGMTMGAEFLSGAAKAAASLPPPSPQAGEKEWESYGKGLADLAMVPATSLFESAESVAFAAKNAFKNGLRSIDFLEEKFDFISRDEAFDRYLRRARANEFWSASKATDQNVFSRIVFQDPRALNVAEQFLYSINSALSPSVEDRLERFNGDREAALREKQMDDLQSTQEILSGIRRDLSKRAPDPDITLAASFTRAGVNPFDIYGKAFGVGLEAARAGKRLAKTAGKSPAQISKMDAAEAAKAFKKEVDAAKAAESPGLLEGYFGSAADKIDAAKARISGALENIPDPVKAATSSLAGGLVGFAASDESPIQGFIGGAGAGLGGYVGRSMAGKAASAASQAPRVAQAMLAGRRLAAGEGSAASAAAAGISKAEELGMSPFVAKKLADKGIPAARALDWIGENAVEMARSSVHGATLAAAVGVLESKDPEQIAELMGEGVLLHAYGEVTKNMFGVSPSRMQALQKRKNAAAAKFYNSLDAQSQAHVGTLTNWNTYVASVRNLAEQAAGESAKAKTDLINASNAGESPERLQKLQEQVDEADRVFSIRKAQLRNAETAGPETAKMFGDQVRYGLADVMNAINGSMTPGKNVELRIQTRNQLADEFLHNNKDKNLNPLEQRELETLIDTASGQLAFIAENGGQYRLSTGKIVDLSNANKTRVTINMDRVMNRVLAGEATLSAAAHEIGHAFWNSKEFREENADVINALFGTQILDGRGNVITGQPGLLSPQVLVDRFKSDYAKGSGVSWQEMAQTLGLWDPVMKDLKPEETASYMRAEVMAELIRGASQGGIKLGQSPKAWMAPLVDWLTIKHKNSSAAKSMREFVGLQGAKPWASELIGVQFSGEAIEATKRALKAVAELQGDITAAETIPHRKISETEIRTNEAVANTFKELFQTEKVATVVDAEGKPVVDPVTKSPISEIPLTDQNVFEGTWENRPNEQGEPNVVQTSGYGSLPEEVTKKLGSVNVPEGGKIVVTSRVKRDSAGSLQMLTPEEARELNRRRGDILRQAMESAPDKEYPGRLSPQTEDRLSFGGVLSPGQVKALKELPETIVPYALKRRILEYNDLLVRDQGDGMVGLYAQAMDARGRYRSFAPKIVDFVPMGLKMSKDGNFLFTLFSKSGMREKLRRWQKDSPELLRLWNGNEAEFMGDLKKVLENWKPTAEFPTGKPGETGIDADPKMAIAKKNRINDFLNIFRKTEDASLYANPSRTTIRKPARRLTKAEKEDELSSDPNTLVRSYRVDRFHDLATSQDEPLRVNYGKALYNLMPESDIGMEEVAPRVFGPALERGIRGAGRIRFMPEGAYVQFKTQQEKADEKPTELRLPTAGDRGGGRAAGVYTPLEGAPRVERATGPDPRINSVAERYAREKGISVRRQAAYVKVDPERAKRIADAYEAMPHSPQDPAVKEAYEDMIRQTKDQYDVLVDSGFEFWFMDPEADPYSGNPWNAMRDLRENQKMAVFPTEAGFGSGATELNVADNPLLADTGLLWPYGSPNGKLKRVLANDLFRAVHDAFGHGIEGAGFRADGEENAWQAHSRLFTGPALGAMTSETRGQNSWLNFGPHGEKNKTAKVEDTVFADQKTGLMPEWTWREGVAPDEALPQNIRFMPDSGVKIPESVEGLQQLPKTISDERGVFSVVIGAKPGEHGYSYRTISELKNQLETAVGQKAAIETWGDLQDKKQRQLELIAKTDAEIQKAKSPKKAAELEVKKAKYAQKVAELDAQTETMLSQFPEKMRGISPEDAAWKSHVKRLNKTFEELSIKATPSPFTASPLGIRSMAELGDSVHDILKSDGFNGILKDFFGIEGLEVRPLSGTWQGQIEPSFDMVHPDLTFDKAKQITQLLTLAFAQDAGITYKPSIDLKEGIQAAYLVHSERLTDEQLKLAFSKAVEVGVDISTTADGKGIKALNFGIEDFFSKLSEIQKAASINKLYETIVDSELYEAKKIFKGRDSKRGLPVWLNATSGGQSLLQRSVDSLLVEYAKAAAAQGYIFDPALYAKRYGLSEADAQYVTDKLYPTDPLARSASPLLAGTEILPVKSTYTLAGKRETAVPDMIHALQMRAASNGVIQPGDYSERAKDIISTVVMDEVQQHMARASLNPKAPNAIGWYDAALKRMKGMYSQLFPWLDAKSPKYDADKSLVFDAVLGITSQGNDVFENGKMATRVVLMLERGDTIPDVVETLKGTFGNQTSAIENNLLKLHELLTRHTPTQLRDLLFKTDTVSNWNKILKQDQSLYYNRAPLSVKGGSGQKVTGFMVFGPKIGSFINNLHGDYSTLTADLWYTRTWNRILGRSFKHDPLREGYQFDRFKEFLIEEYNRNQAIKKGNKYTDRVDYNKKGEPELFLYGKDAPDVSNKQFQQLLENDAAMLELARSIEKEFRTGGYKVKSDLRRAAKNWVQDRENPLAAPRASLERAFQQSAMEEAQAKLSDAGTAVTIADMQAALWFNEKELFGKYGAAATGAEPADYADAANFILDVIKAGGLFQVERKGKVVRLLPEDSEAKLTNVHSPNKNLMKELLQKEMERKEAERVRKEAEGEEENEE